jgi:hypothetical protein
MKILIVTPFFPPQNAIASLRPYSWAKYWGRQGHEITVYTTSHYGVMSNLNTNLKNVKIVEIPIPFVQKFISSYNNRTKNNNNKSSKVSIRQKIVVFLRGIYRLIGGRKGCFYCVRYPDIRDIWARNIISKIKGSFFDMVITTGGPYSVHRVGLVLKKKLSNIFWVVDWRDLWTQNHVFKGIKIFHWYEKRLEKEFHRRCDLITTVSDGFADNLRKITSSPVEVVLNGFDSEDYIELFKSPRKKNDCLVIVYTGTLYTEIQNIYPLLEAISNLNIEKKIFPGDIKIVFAGANCDIQEIINKMELKDYYFFRGFLPREEALKMLFDADVILFFAYNEDEKKGILSGKVFEYLSLSKEIWSIGMTRMTEADRLIENANAGIIFGTNVDNIKSYIMAKISDKVINVINKNYDFISSFERKNQAAKLLSLYYKTRTKY